MTDLLIEPNRSDHLFMICPIRPVNPFYADIASTSYLVVMFSFRAVRSMDTRRKNPTTIRTINLVASLSRQVVVALINRLAHRADTPIRSDSLACHRRGVHHALHAVHESTPCTTAPRRRSCICFSGSVRVRCAAGVAPTCGARWLPALTHAVDADGLHYLYHARG